MVVRVLVRVVVRVMVRVVVSGVCGTCPHWLHSLPGARRSDIIGTKFRLQLVT